MSTIWLSMPRGSAALDGIIDLEGGDMFGDVVNTENRGAASRGNEISGDRADEAPVDARSEYRPEQALARNADEQRQAVVAKAIKLAQRCQVLRRGFAEADAWIENEM